MPLHHCLFDSTLPRAIKQIKCSELVFSNVEVKIKFDGMHAEHASFACAASMPQRAIKPDESYHRITRLLHALSSLSSTRGCISNPHTRHILSASGTAFPFPSGRPMVIYDGTSFISTSRKGWSLHLPNDASRPRSYQHLSLQALLEPTALDVPHTTARCCTNHI